MFFFRKMVCVRVCIIFCGLEVFVICCRCRCMWVIWVRQVCRFRVLLVDMMLLFVFFFISWSSGLNVLFRGFCGLVVDWLMIGLFFLFIRFLVDLIRLFDSFFFCCFVCFCQVRVFIRVISGDWWILFISVSWLVILVMVVVGLSCRLLRKFSQLLVKLVKQCWVRCVFSVFGDRFVDIVLCELFSIQLIFFWCELVVLLMVC